MSIISHDTLTVAPRHPGYGGDDFFIARPPAELSRTLQQALWGHFVYRVTATYYGTCASDECADPWALNLETGELKQCGCEDFTPGEPFIPLAREILARTDLTPKPRRTRWFLLNCPDIEGCGAWQAGWWLDGLSGTVVPCMSCGWSPLMPKPWEH